MSFQPTFCERGRQQDVLSLPALGVQGIEYHRDILLKTQIQDSVVSREGVLLRMQREGCNETAETALCPTAMLLDEAHLSASSKISHRIRLK